MLTLKTNLKKSASDTLEIPAILRRDGPAVKVNPDAEVIKAAKVTITTVPQGMTAKKAAKEKAKKEKLPVPAPKTVKPIPTKGPTPEQNAKDAASEIAKAKKPTKKQTAADDAVKSVAKPKSKMPPVGKLAYDWTANEALAKSGKLPNLGPWKSYDVHMKNARELCGKGDFKAAEEIMGGHRNTAKNRDDFYNLLKLYIKAKS
jgi:hypothetical protein